MSILYTDVRSFLMGRKQSFDNYDAIVDCAFDLIREEGFKAFSTRKLATRLSISKTTAYNYLSNKEEIIRLVVEKGQLLFFREIFTLAEKRSYMVSDFYELFLISAEVLYDFIREYGDVFKLIYREFSRSFEEGLTVEETFVFLKPLFSHFFPDFEFSEYSEFRSPDFLNRFHYLNVLITELAIIELNRKKKIGKEKYLSQVYEAWELLTGNKLPSWIL